MREDGTDFPVRPGEVQRTLRYRPGSAKLPS